MTMKSLSRQVGGKHYQNEGIEPAEYIIKNKLPFAEGNAIKYISRHKDKGGKEDLLKAVHYIEMILEDSYGVGLDGKPLTERVACYPGRIQFESEINMTPEQYDLFMESLSLSEMPVVPDDYEDMKEYCQS